MRRHSGTKTTVPLDGIDATVRVALDEAQVTLLADALERRRAATAEVASIDEALEATRSGFAVLPLEVLGAEGETRLNRAGVTVRLLSRPDGTLPGPDDHGPDADLVAVVAHAY